MIPEWKIYPRSQGHSTVYLQNVVTDPAIQVGAYTIAWDNHGDIVVGNDVWIGYEAVILAGVTIGDGAIIGSRAVVTKDVPPYTIVGGLPAKPIRRRYDEETAARLEKLRWWDWPEAQVRRAIPLLQAGDLDALEKLV